jgi:hypothetical protein
MCMNFSTPIVSKKNFSAALMSFTTQATWQNFEARFECFSLKPSQPLPYLKAVKRMTDKPLIRIGNTGTQKIQMTY